MAPYNRKYSDQDGMVDLVIDENSPKNYFIDFEINRLSGNLPSDYAQSSNTGTVDGNGHFDN